MKKQMTLLLSLMIMGLSFAQGDGFNYKALITDNGNVLATHSVTFRFTVVENGTTSVYQETQTTTTDANGIVAVSLGEGTTILGNFSSIDWSSNPYFLKVEIDTGGGYQDFGTSEFRSVPYAKYAEKSEIAEYVNHSFWHQTSNAINSPDRVSIGRPVSAEANLHIKDVTGGEPLLKMESTDNVFTIWESNRANVDDYLIGIDGGNNRFIFANTTTGDFPLAIKGNRIGVNQLNPVAALDVTGHISMIDGNQSADKVLVSDASGVGSWQMLTNNAAFSGWDKDASDDFDGNFSSLSNIPAGLSDGDDDTQLTDAQIAAMGYIKDANDADHDASNELQTLTLNSTQLSISNGNNVDFTGWDIDASDDFSGNYNDLSNQPVTFYKSGGGLPTNIHDDMYHYGNIAIGTSSINSSSRVYIMQSGSSSGSKVGVYANVSNSNNDGHFGYVATLAGNGNGTFTGLRNNVSGDGNNFHYGVYNNIGGAGTGDQFGVYNKVYSSGSGIHYGTYHYLLGTGTGRQYGVYNEISNSGNNIHYGNYSILTGSGAGSHIGTNNSVGGSGNGTHIGVTNFLSGTGTGNKYGTYNFIPTSAGGTHYAVYGEAEKSGSYAGYFKGDVYASKKIKAPTSGSADMKAYIYGTILATGSQRPTASSSGFTNMRESTGTYKISFTDNSIQADHYLVMLTKASSSVARFVSVVNNNGFFRVYVLDLSGNLVNGGFNFVVYKK